jgi:hypothetical protein
VDLLRSTVNFGEGRAAPDSIYGVLHRECINPFPDEMLADLSPAKVAADFSLLVAAVSPARFSMLGLRQVAVSGIPSHPSTRRRGPPLPEAGLAGQAESRLPFIG